MIDKFSLARRLVLGDYTPFLATLWGHEEIDAINSWISGDEFPTAKDELEASIKGSLGKEWTVLGVNLGRSAIQIALEAMALPKNSEVLVPSFGCTGVVMPIIQAGLRPVFIDVDDDFNASYHSVLEADSSEVKAIILCHLSGLWAKDTIRIIEWAQNRGIFVIEDAAQALGLVHQGRPVGTYGDVGIFSCHVGKAIHSSGGGWLVTRRADIVANLTSNKIMQESRVLVKNRLEKFCDAYCESLTIRGRRLVHKAIVSKLTNKHNTDNTNISDFKFKAYQISDIEAKLISLQLPKLPLIIEQRRANSKKWIQLLLAAEFDGIKYLPLEHNACVKMLISGSGSKSLSQKIWQFGVELEGSYKPLHLRKPFEHYRRTSMKSTENHWKSAISLPVRPNLTEEDWHRINKAIYLAKAPVGDVIASRN